MKIEIIAERSGIYGGLKRLYLLATYFIESGHQAVVNIADGSRNNWFEHNVPENVPIDPDIRILPETWQKPHPTAKNILYVQAQFDEPENSFDGIITTSSFLHQELAKNGWDSKVIPYGFDIATYSPNPDIRVPGKIGYMPRKNASEANLIKSLVPSLNFKALDGLSESELIIEYQSCDLFMAVSRVEGFGLPPPEAALCGSLVVGYHGFGGLDWMKEGETYIGATSPEEIAFRLSQLAKAPDEKVRQAGREILTTKFPKEKEAQDWLRLLEQVV